MVIPGISSTGAGVSHVGDAHAGSVQSTIPMPLSSPNIPGQRQGGVVVTKVEGSMGPNPQANLPQTPAHDFAWRVVNRGPDFKQEYHTDVWHIPAGAETVLPYEVAITFFGNPELRNWSPRRMDRDREFNRLRVRYGVYDDLDKWEEVKPRFDVFSTSTGERIATVVDDPTGKGVHQSVQSVATEQAAMQQVQALSEQVAMLTQILLQKGEIQPTEAMVGQPDDPTITQPTAPAPTSTPTAPVAVDAIPEDKPKRVAVGQRAQTPRLGEAE